MANPLRDPRRLGWLLLAGALAAAAVLLVWLQRHLAFDGDSFNWLVLGGIDPAKALIEPYGGHLIFVPLLVFKATIAVAGTSYTAFTVVQVAMLLTLSVLVYEYGRRRVGPLLALPAAIVLPFLGSSWNVLLQPMLGIQFLCGLVPGLAAILVLEREDRRGDVAACALLTVATFGFELGLAFVAGAAVSVLARRDRWRRLWIVAVPVLAYLIWKLWASQYPQPSLQLENLIWLPAFVVDSIGVLVASLFGLFYLVGGGQLTWMKFTGFELGRFCEGVVLAVFELLAGLAIVRRLRARGPIPVSFWAALAMLATVWLEHTLALAPDRTPGEIRYILPDSVFLLLFALEAARGVRVSATSLIVAGAIGAAMVIGNLARLQEGREILAEFSPLSNASMAVLVLGGDHVPEGFVPGEDAAEAFPEGRGAFIEAGDVRRVARRLGSPGYTVAELRAQPEWVRRSADIVAARGLGLETEATARRCRPLAGGTTVTLPPGGAVLAARQASPLLLRRFGDEFAVEVGAVGPRPVRLRIPTDDAAVPWRARAPHGAGLTLCPRG